MLKKNNVRITMNKTEYALYLGGLIDDFDIDIDGYDLEEQFYAYFQCFMPDGREVEKVFSPLDNGDELLQRLMPIYTTTSAKTKRLFDQGRAPGYFCPEPSGTTEVLVALGHEHLVDLKTFVQFIKDDVLLEKINAVSDIVVFDTEPERGDCSIQEYLHDVISDWALSQLDDTSCVSLLGEAYYSINCDYWLSYYLQYPTFKKKPDVDFLKNYFKIWSKGFHCRFDNNQLVIFKR